MVVSFLKLRIYQALRIFTGMNWPYRLVLLFFMLWAIAGVTAKTSQDQGSHMIPLIFLLALASFHWFRPDIQFLKIYFPSYELICLSEYVILSAPILTGLMFSEHTYYTFVYIPALVLMVFFIQPKRRTTGKARSLSLVSSQFFEWKSGLRKYFYPILVVWLSGIFFSFHMAAGIISIVMIGLLTLGFYDQCESESMLVAAQQSPSEYLKNRAKGLFAVSGTIYSPILLLFLIFHSQHWYIITILTLVTWSYQFYALTIKYAFLEPNSKSSKNTILLSLGALVFVLPFILPAIWVLTVRLYFKSIQKLNFYLHDFNQ